MSGILEVYSAARHNVDLFKINVVTEHMMNCMRAVLGRSVTSALLAFSASSLLLLGFFPPFLSLALLFLR